MTHIDKKIMMIVVLLAMVNGSILGQGVIDNYRRAEAVRMKYSWKMANGDVNVHRMDDGHRFFYVANQIIGPSFSIV